MKTAANKYRRCFESTTSPMVPNLRWHSQPDRDCSDHLSWDEPRSYVARPCPRASWMDWIQRKCFHLVWEPSNRWSVEVVSTSPRLRYTALLWNARFRRLCWSVSRRMIESRHTSRIHNQFFVGPLRLQVFHRHPHHFVQIKLRQEATTRRLVLRIARGSYFFVFAFCIFSSS